MSDEIERLRADLEVLERYQANGCVRAVKEKIARLEAEAADPWRDAKQQISVWRNWEHPENIVGQHGVVAYFDHLTSELAAKERRIAELEAEIKAEDEADIADAEAVLRGNPAWTNFQEAIGHHWTSGVKPLVDVAAILNAAIEAGLVARRIPDADDPRVLRRALLDVAKDLIWTSDIDIDETVEEWIEDARREIESEAGNAQGS